MSLCKPLHWFAGLVPRRKISSAPRLRSLQLNARYMSSTPKRDCVFAFDFDKTITECDTTGYILEVGMGREGFPDEKRTRWREYAAAYEIQWDAILKQKLQACETGVEAPSLFFSELDKFELDSLQATVKGQYLQGLTLPAGSLITAARSLKLRDGAIQCLNDITSHSAHPVHIISISWEASLIATALSHANIDLSKIRVWANNLEMGPDGLTTGNLVGHIHCSQDKVDVSRHVRRTFPGICVAYVGDGIVDIPALQEADVGILFDVGGSTPTSKEVLDRLQLPSTTAQSIMEGESEAVKGKVIVAKSWEQIAAVFRKLELLP